MNDPRSSWTTRTPCAQGRKGQQARGSCFGGIIATARSSDMLIKKLSDISSSDITSKSVYLRRREFLQAAGLTTAAALTGVFGAERGASAAEKLVTKFRIVTTEDQISPLKDISTYNNYYEFGADKDDPSKNAWALKTSPWSVTVEGLCNKPGTYTLEDILKPQPLEERVYRMRCVEAWSMVIPWDGFPLRDLLNRFEPQGKATFVEFTTVSRPSEM